MKKFIILIFAIIFAFLASEFVIYNIVGYPKRTEFIKYSFLPTVKGFEILKYREPHTKYWTVEGGNKIYQYNNLSVTGRDVYPDDKSTLIFVLGDSFVEASSVPPDSNVNSIFQDKLNSLDTNLKVINLGFPNSDPYTLWFRTMFFEKSLKPEYVILLVTDLDLLDLHMQRYKDTLDFSIPDKFATIIPHSKSENFFGFFRKRFSVLNLISASLSVEGSREGGEKYLDKNTVRNYNESLKKFYDCLLKYKEKFGQKFIVVSLEADGGKNNRIVQVCDSLEIKYSNKKLLTKEYLWGEGYHLNNKGNKEFGTLLYETFIQVYKK